MQQAANVANLNWLLNDLIQRVPGARNAIVLSADGLLMASSDMISREDAEHLAAVASSIQSLARGVSQRFSGGPTRQTVIEMESAVLLVTAAGRGACLGVLSEAQADMGMIAYEMAMLVGRLGTHLTAADRTAVGEPGGR